ncbi:hypothetical protein QAD02_017919 [Eretmocerus hayati]|uniref:Uncharacterized protein n=1 Tax=Eretmocerus hayati TaxID=131215 RepID=A0ACC2PF84_9HYME|nr:hypothetical protein QAD02_017919 [Eretmocerus hayati]
MEQNIILIGSKLIIDGFIYHKSRDKPELEKTFWDCTRLRKKEYRARAISTLARDGEVPRILKGPQHEPFHSHAPDQDECEAEVVKYSVKNEAQRQPERPPSQIARDATRDLSQRVLARLPERENLKRSMRKVRRRHLPANPRILDELLDLPERFTITFTGKKFLIYDSREVEDVGRVIVSATKRNLLLLRESDVWFLDGTFKVSPSIFTQLFTVLGIVKRHQNFAALPLVYALLSSKETRQYSTALQAIKSAAEERSDEELEFLELIGSNIVL